MKKVLFFIIISLFVMTGCTKKSNTQNDIDLSNAQEPLSPSPALERSGIPEMEINTENKYKAVLDTSAGKITLSLFADKTPITVNNFVSLARKGFYTNTIFHRAVNGFMIQGGDPKGDGTGGPGYTFKDEPFEGEYLRGTVAMANAGPNTNGSQFFIMHKDYPLPKNYVIFGQVISGLEVVDKIAETPVKENSMGEMSKPINPVVVKAVEITEE
jgi:cyclophilin family peptidyl-prolyl cis-trans isomerase